VIKRVVISSGEPAGIGPDIVIQIAQQNWPAELVVVGDPVLFTERAHQLNLPLKLIPAVLTDPPVTHTPQTLKIFGATLNKSCKPGQLDKANAAYVLDCLNTATDACLQHKAQALVTGPIQKSILNEAGFSFTGHTEYLADYCKSGPVVMLFVTPDMKVALATTHLPLAKVSAAITKDLIIQTLTVLREGLIKQFSYENPTILVCGLNPHAGEMGHLGHEEIDIIEPALKTLRLKNWDIRGPFSADTIFHQKSDAILAMYHDQALPLIKYTGFYSAVNVTLGLPIIRTSVDHGTALDLAGTGQANSESLSAAIRLALG